MPGLNGLFAQAVFRCCRMADTTSVIAGPSAGDPAEPDFAQLRDVARQAASLPFPNAVGLIAAALHSVVPGGEGDRVEDERILFRSHPSMGFPAGDVAAISIDERAGAEWPVEMEVNFLGLYGPSSPLPVAWTERIVMDAGDGAANLRDVLDLFGHRLVALSYRIWRHYRLHLQADAVSTRAVRAVLAMAGVMPDEAWPAGILDPFRLLPLCGLLAQHSRSAAVIVQLIEAYFGVPAAIWEWQPRMVPIAPADRFVLGGSQAVLGDGTVLGTSVPDIGSTISLVLGPLTDAQFHAFLPGAMARRSLSALLRVVLRQPVTCELELVLRREAAMGMVLGDAYLGWTSWAGEGEVERSCTVGAA